LAFKLLSATLPAGEAYERGKREGAAATEAGKEALLGGVTAVGVCCGVGCQILAGREVSRRAGQWRKLLCCSGVLLDGQGRVIEWTREALHIQLH